MSAAFQLPIVWAAQAALQPQLLDSPLLNKKPVASAQKAPA